MIATFHKYLSVFIGLLVLFTFSFKMVMVNTYSFKEHTHINGTDKSVVDDDLDNDLEKKTDHANKYKFLADDWHSHHPLSVGSTDASEAEKSYFHYLHFKCSEPFLCIETPPPDGRTA